MFHLLRAGCCGLQACGLRLGLGQLLGRGLGLSLGRCQAGGQVLLALLAKSPLGGGLLR